MVFRPARFMSMLIALTILLAACSTEDAVPTPAPLALLPVPIEEVTPILLGDLLPSTFTPAPTTIVDPARNFNQVAALGPTLTPSVTPIFPTRTPRPTFTPTPTPTSDATPTRYRSNIPPQIPTGALGPSKLGLHVIRNNDAWIMEFVRQAQPAVIKAVDDFGYLDQVKVASPRTIIVGRVNDPAQNYGGNPEEAARRYVQEHLDQYQANLAVDYWEGWNEPDPNVEWMWWYARFEQERVREMARYGFRSAIGGFSTGVPELNEFEIFLPAIETALEYNSILTLHEYGAPDLMFGYGAALPGYPAYPDRGALKFRYRWYYREFLEPRGLVIPLVISEAGVDGIIGNRPGPNGTGWQDFANYWVAQGWGQTGEEAFINQLAWYDNGVRQDGYVIGFTVFTAGGFGYWENYNINSMLPELSDYVVQQRR